MTQILTRRNLLVGVTGLLAAPAVLRLNLHMPISSRGLVDSSLWDGWNPLHLEMDLNVVYHNELLSAFGRMVEFCTDNTKTCTIRWKTLHTGKEVHKIFRRGPNPFNDSLLTI